MERGKCAKAAVGIEGHNMEIKFFFLFFFKNSQDFIPP